MLQSQTTNVKTIPRLIFNATNTSRQTLKSCCEVRALMREAWAENRLFDFNLWAAGVGASAKSTASLDFRLESQREGKTVVIGVLLTLQAALEECKDLGTKRDLGQDEPYISESESFESPGSEEDQNSVPFPSWSDNSSSDSSSDASSTESAQDGLSVAMKNVEDLIDQLIQLGKIIRSSGATSRFRKADKAFDPAAYKDLQHYLKVLLLSNPRAIENQRPSAERIDWKDPFLTLDFATIDKLDLDHQKVVDHLISANLRRRSRFDYARKHARKLAAHYDPQESVQTALPGPHQDDLVKHSDALASPGMSEETPKKQDPASNETPQVCHAALTDTTAASLVDPSLTITHPIPPSKFTMSRASVSLSRLNYPNPPSISSHTKSFRCPCCFQTLSLLDHEVKRWRKHLSQDILPYTCIFPDCSVEKCFYATRESWKQHMRQDHSGSTYWECLACSNFDTTEIFPDVEQFREHTRSVHGNTITEEQLLTLERVCSKSSPASIESCPLCIYKDQDEIPMDPETLLNHIGDHIHDFSLLSLPWADFSEEVDAEIIEAATEKAMKWDITFPSDMETVDLPPLKPQQPRTPNPERLFAAAEYFSGVASGPEDRGSGAESSLTELLQPMIDRIRELAKLLVSATDRIWELLKLPRLSLHFISDWWRERCPGQSLEEDFPQAVAFHPEEYHERLQEEPLRRLVRLNVIDQRIDGREDRPGKDVWVTFDLNFKETPGRPPFILVSESVFSDAKPAGFKAYDDATNPPIPAKNADGSNMKFLGEFLARWSPVGPTNGYVHQQIFLLEGKSITSQCVLVPADSPFDVLIGYGTIKKHKLDTAWTIVNAINEQGHDQGGRRDGGSRVNHDAVKEKKLILDAHKKDQFRLQQTIEKAREKNRKSKKTGEAKEKSKAKGQ